MAAEITTTKVLGNKILVKKMEFGVSKTAGGIIRPDDDMKLWGARPRWCEVLAVGPDVDYTKPGQFICMSHGAWTRGFAMTENGEKVIVRMIDNREILLVSDEPTAEYSQSDKI